MHRPIEITKKDRGFVVKVGCKELVFENRESLFQALRLYFNDPAAAEKKYLPKKNEPSRYEFKVSNPFKGWMASQYTRDYLKSLGKAKNEFWWGDTTAESLRNHLKNALQNIPGARTAPEKP